MWLLYVNVLHYMLGTQSTTMTELYTIIYSRTMNYKQRPPVLYISHRISHRLPNNLEAIPAAADHSMEHPLLYTVIAPTPALWIKPFPFFLNSIQHDSDCIVKRKSILQEILLLGEYGSWVYGAGNGSVFRR